MLFAVAALLCLSAFAGIYGTHDDRVLATPYDLAKLVESGIYPAAMIDHRYHDYTLRSRWNLCRDEKFVNERAMAACSGFLIAPDVLVTAAHCLEDQEICNSEDSELSCAEKVCTNTSWLFHYLSTNYQQNGRPLNIRDTIRCKEVMLWQKYDFIDFAVLRLRKAHPGYKRDPELAIPEEGDSLNLAGFPLGAPLTLTENGILEKKRDQIYLSNIDAFKVNSGSVVFDQNNKIVGVLVAGKKDLQLDMSGLGKTGSDFQPICNRYYKCPHCKGLERIVPIQEILQKFELSQN